MWICKRCAGKLHHSEYHPAIDHLGAYFLCPRCGYRNSIAAIRRPGGPLKLVLVGGHRAIAQEAILTPR